MNAYALEIMDMDESRKRTSVNERCAKKENLDAEGQLLESSSVKAKNSSHGDRLNNI